MKVIFGSFSQSMKCYASTTPPQFNVGWCYTNNKNILGFNIVSENGENFTTRCAILSEQSVQDCSTILHLKTCKKLNEFEQSCKLLN